MVEFDEHKNSNMILWGTKQVEWWGVDYTKKDMDFQNNTFKDIWMNAENKYIDTLVKNKSIGLWQDNLIHLERKFITIRCMDLPLEQDGDVTHIFSAYISCKSDRELLDTVEPTHTFEFDM